MSTTKISALCTYLRIATGTKYRRFVWVTLAFIAVWAVGTSSLDPRGRKRKADQILQHSFSQPYSAAGKPVPSNRDRQIAKNPHRPVHLYWTSHDGKGCTDEGIRLLSATVINIITDFLVVLMPVPIIFKLQIPLREKIILAVLMSLGLL